MKRALLALVVCLLLLGPLDSVAAQAFPCSRMIGPSIARQEWDAGFETFAGAAIWEGQTKGGATLDHWVVGGDAWGTRILSPCGSPTRVLLMAAPSAGASAEVIANEIRAAVAGIHVHVPSATTITLYPPPGTPNDAPCSQASIYHDVIVQAELLAAGGDVFVGPDSLVRDCLDYADRRGHLTSAGALYVAQNLALALGLA